MTCLIMVFENNEIWLGADSQISGFGGQLFFRDKIWYKNKYTMSFAGSFGLKKEITTALELEDLSKLSLIDVVFEIGNVLGLYRTPENIALVFITDGKDINRLILDGCKVVHGAVPLSESSWMACGDGDEEARNYLTSNRQLPIKDRITKALECAHKASPQTVGGEPQIINASLRAKN